MPINPSENQPPPKAPTISIPNESFSSNNGHLAKTYMLLLRVYCTSNNGCLMHNCDLDGTIFILIIRNIIFQSEKLIFLRLILKKGGNLIFLQNTTTKYHSFVLRYDLS